jgi:group II intron reverse transcriptase/maturase
LKEAHKNMPLKKATGVDKIGKKQYGRNLDKNVQSLLSRVRDNSYYPKPIKRTYIRKFGNQMRPIGIICYEDKLVSSNIEKLLSAIYEPKFKKFSYGFRPNRNCHSAIRQVVKLIKTQPVNYIVESDIKSFFDTLDHNLLISFLKIDIGDERFLQLIKKFLKNGVFEEGKYQNGEKGIPQGNVMSPILANIYLHYVLDLWFDEYAKKHCTGRAFIVRYADDFICMFQFRFEAKNFLKELIIRLKKFNLDVAPDKTKLLNFGKKIYEEWKKTGINKLESFNFLGFTFHCGYSSNKFFVFIKTNHKVFLEKLKIFKEWLHKNNDLSMDKIVKRINSILLGHYNYYGVNTNMRLVHKFKMEVEKIMFNELNKKKMRKHLKHETLKNLQLVSPKIHFHV